MKYFTVKEMADLAHVTVKTLHHYHKIGLLKPCKLSEAGYRLYGQAELERLQEILFYRELDFSLQDIIVALAGDADRVSILSRQRALLSTRRRRLDRLIQTLDESITHADRSETMANEAMFKGFNEDEWREALSEQADYLKETYDVDLLAQPIQAERMNVMAQEVITFQQALAHALREGWAHRDERVQQILADHLTFLNAHEVTLDRQGALAQARFFINDDFHRNMLESAQVGLAYYYLAVVEVNAEAGEYDLRIANRLSVD